MNHHNIEIGTIFYTTWGYEQTNVDFYEVIELVGKCTLILRELNQTDTSNKYGLSGKTMPIPSSYADEPFRKRVTATGRVKISSCQLASIWSGKPLYYSQYA